MEKSILNEVLLRLISIDNKIDRLNSKIDDVEERLNKKIDDVEERLNKKIDDVNQKVDDLKDYVDNLHKKQIFELGKATDTIGIHVDEIFENHEVRIAKIEKAI